MIKIILIYKFRKIISSLRDLFLTFILAVKKVSSLRD